MLAPSPSLALSGAAAPLLQVRYANEKARFRVHGTERAAAAAADLITPYSRCSSGRGGGPILREPPRAPKRRFVGAALRAPASKPSRRGGPIIDAEGSVSVMFRCAAGFRRVLWGVYIYAYWFGRGVASFLTRNFNDVRCAMLVRRSSLYGNSVVSRIRAFLSVLCRLILYHVIIWCDSSC